MELSHVYLAVLSISVFFKYLTFYFLFSISTLYFDAPYSVTCTVSIYAQIEVSLHCQSGKHVKDARLPACRQDESELPQFFQMTVYPFVSKFFKDFL